MKTSYWFAGVSLLALCVYVFTSIPGVGFTDAGELAGACYSLGVAHPTGYPLFVLLGFVWSHIPLPLSVIARMNVFAAVCTALSTGFVFLLCKELFAYVLERIDKKSPTVAARSSQKRGSGSKSKSQAKNEGIVSEASEIAEDVSAPQYSQFVQNMSVGTALSYAFAQTVWAQATGIEVYSLHLCLMSICLWLSIRAIATSNTKLMRLAALSLGLCFSNHLTSILIAGPIVLLFFYRPGTGLQLNKERLREFLFLLAIIVCCSLFYGTLVLNSLNAPWFNWGAVHRGWEQFSYHVFGKQYSIWMFSDEKGAVARQFKVFLHLLGPNTAYIGALASVYALWTLLRHSALRAFGIFFLALIVIGVGYSVNYSIHDIDSYFLSAYTAMIVAGGLGFSLVLRTRKSLAPLCMLLPLALVFINWKDSNQRDNTLVQDYVHMMVDPLPKNAVLVSQQWDYLCSAFWYMQQVEGYRPDVTLVEKELLRRTWYPRQLQRWYPSTIQSSASEIDSYLNDLSVFEHDAEAFQEDQLRVRAIQTKFIAMLNSVIARNIDSRPIYATQEVFQGEEGLARGYVLSPYGMCLRIARDSAVQSIDTTTLRVQDFARASHAHHEEHLEQGILESAEKQLLSNVPTLAVAGRFNEALWYCSQVLSINPKNSTALQYSERLRQSLAQPQAQTQTQAQTQAQTQTQVKP